MGAKSKGDVARAVRRRRAGPPPGCRGSERGGRVLEGVLVGDAGLEPATFWV